jgi:chromosome partitioning protein
MITPMRTIAVAGQKGDSGKTTTTLALGAILAREYNQRVLLVDVDPQANLSIACDVDGEGVSLAEVLDGMAAIQDVLAKIASRLQILPGDIALAHVELSFFKPPFSAESAANWPSLGNKLKRVLKAIEADFDFALLDLPSSLGLLTVNGLVAAQEVLIPARPEYIHLRALASLVNMLNDLHQGLHSTLANPDLAVVGVLPTFFNPRLRHHSEIITVWKETGIPTLNVCIQDSAQHVEAFLASKPIIHYNPENPLMQAYRQVAEVIVKGSTQEDWGLGMADF